MTVRELCEAAHLELLAGDAMREVTGGVYTCDLLSLVMGRAPDDCVWVTVMANQNAVVAGMMADVACIVFAEGIRPEEAVLQRAEAEGLCALFSGEAVYPTAKRLDRALGGI